MNHLEAALSNGDVKMTLLWGGGAIGEVVVNGEVIATAEMSAVEVERANEAPWVSGRGGMTWKPMLEKLEAALAAMPGEDVG